MKKSIIFFLAFCSFASCAAVAKLEKIAFLAENFYRLGYDNNYLDTKIISMTSIEKLQKIPLITTDEQLMSLEECVFMPQGAYGLHIEKDLAERMAHQLLLQLRATFNDHHYPYSFYRMYRIDVTDKDAPEFNWRSGIDAAPCILVLEDILLGETLLMSAAITD